MTAKQVYDQGLERLKTFKVEGLLPSLQYCSRGAIDDVLNTNGCCYYQWSSCIVDVFKPHQVVELGGAMGVWCLCVLHYLPEESKFYSITLEEHGLEFSFIKDKYANFTPIVGDDLDIQNWQGVDLSQTDLWFIDSLHTEEHLRAELKLYSPYFKKGAVILLDDIRMGGLDRAWSNLLADEGYDCYDGTDPLHFSGYGICVKI